MSDSPLQAPKLGPCAKPGRDRLDPVSAFSDTAPAAVSRGSRRARPRVAARLAGAAVLTALVAGCAGQAEAPDGFAYDPYEKTNREIHEFNKGWDTILLRPLAQGYDFAMPALGDLLLTNALNLISMPMIFINHVLQGDVEAALADVGRVGINIIMGAGVLDPATEFGLPQPGTDLGLTFAQWGFDEGPYVELPFLGPATTRDGVGRVLEIALDPLGLFPLPGVNQVVFPAAAVTGVVKARANNMGLVDQLFYESEDSYVSVRSAYLQNRRRVVDGGPTQETLTDVFAE